MIAVPLSTRKTDSPILSHFSKVKFLALRDDSGTTKLLVNNADTPEHTLDLLHVHGVTTLICSYLTQSTLNHAINLGITVFDCGRETINLDAAVQKYQENALTQLPKTLKSYNV